MSDFDQDDEIFKKLQAEEDDVKPIDMGMGAGEPKPAHTPSPGSPAFEDSDIIARVTRKTDVPAPIDTRPNALMPDGEFRQELPADMAAEMFASEYNYVNRGDYLDLSRKVPGLNLLRVGAGWEQRALEEERVDIDLSAFILNREDITRIDEDFVFYGNPTGADGGIKHTGDSRNGAGEGDDEVVNLDLNSIPFDAQKIMFVLSIYDEESKGLNFSMVRDIFIRLVNENDQNEICRFAFADDELIGGNGCYVASLIREGPKWYFEVMGTFINGGLAEIAQKYGIIVRELQSTGA